MSNTNWKQKLIKPSHRKQVFSKKENRWLSLEEEQEVLRLLSENQKKIMEGLANEPDLSPELKAKVQEIVPLPLDDEPCNDG